MSAGNAPKTLGELEAMTDADIYDRYEKAAENVLVGNGFWLDELDRRAQRRSAEAAERLTRWSFVLTVIATGAAIIATIAAVISVWPS